MEDPTVRSVDSGSKLGSKDLESLSPTPSPLDCERNGTWVTASAHVITAVIGAGVLSLSYAVSWLGWVLGPLFIVIFAWITLYTAQLLVDMYCVNGKVHRTYKEAVVSVFGPRGGTWIAVVQYPNLVLTALSYNIVGGQTIKTLVRNQCNATGATDCFDSYWVFALAFAGLQLFLSQLPNLDSAWWASAIGATMSFGYSFITLGLSIAQGNTHGTVMGRDASPPDKTFGVFNALGAIVFAFSFAFVLFEIQDTIPDRPTQSATQAMRRAVNVSMAVITAFFMAIAVAGYMAFGNSVPSIILDAFTHPLWLIQLTNAMLLVHMGPAYQVFSQPVFQAVERSVAEKLQSGQVSRFTMRIGIRSLYVVVIGFAACCMPFFGDMVGLVGALGFWPATVFFPCELYRRVFKPRRSVVWLLHAVNVFCFIITLLAIIGSVQSIVVDASTYKFFS